jgi:hypothetical protein
LLVVFLLTAAWPSSSDHLTKAVDFHTAWIGGGFYLHGESPYPRAVDEFVAAGPSQSFVQTPVVAALFAPISLASYEIASAFVALLLAAAVCTALLLAGVRDWRCFGATFLSPAVLTSISIGTLTPLILLAIAVAWRSRGSARTAALAVAGAIATKLLVWPLVVWLWVAGRRTAAVWGAAVAAAFLAFAFAPLGMNVAVRYPHLLARDSHVIGPLSYSVVSLVPGHPGISIAVLEVLGLAIAAFALIVASRAGLDERLVFATAVTASVTLSPVVHLHYLGLLPIVLAVLSPSFSAAWLLPVLLWITPQQDANEAVWRTVLVIAVMTALFAHGRISVRLLPGHRAPV